MTAPRRWSDVVDVSPQAPARPVAAAALLAVVAAASTVLAGVPAVDVATLLHQL